MSPPQPYPGSVPTPGGRRRDRHGRGPRGPLAPPDVPLARSRSELFDDLVLDAVETLERRWGEQLRGVEFAVEDVPPAEAGQGDVMLGTTLPGTRSRPARVVVYRRPLELRAVDRAELADLVHEVVVEQVADLLHLDPEIIDPGYEPPE